MASQATYPVRVEAQLDSGLSRWLWLLKWLLVIPHYIVLAFLWMAFMVLSVVAFFSILFAGRYPRTIFDFNVGVLRWSWRVAYYSYGALATDRYPPFALGDVADYPVHLEIEYPERLSRGLVLIKWWLLALPHYIVVALLMGGTWLTFSGDGWEVAGFGLIGLLAVVAGVVLAFTGSYPAALFDLLLGFNRWVLRVAAYAGLMTDAYPPFRLDTGGSEPRTSDRIPPPPPPTPRPASGTVSPAKRRGWTAGTTIALIFGCLVALAALGGLAGGGVALWADTSQRDGAGFVTTPSVELDSRGYAIVATGLDVHTTEGPDWVLPRAILGNARVRVTPEGDAPVFVGIAESTDVNRYLNGVSYATVPHLATEDGHNLAVVSGMAQKVSRKASPSGSRSRPARAVNPSRGRSPMVHGRSS